jgi:hypothetical protein
MSSEVICLLKQYVPTKADLRRRKRLLRRMTQLQRRVSLTPGPFPSSEEMLREDRAR